MLQRALLSTVSLSHQVVPLSLGTGTSWGPRHAGNSTPWAGLASAFSANICGRCGVSDNIASASLAI